MKKIINKVQFKSYLFFLIMLCAGFAFSTVYLTSDVDARSSGCGVVGNCYYVPDGCGEGVGCKPVHCTSSLCPDPGEMGEGCHVCSESEDEEDR